MTGTQGSTSTFSVGSGFSLNALKVRLVAWWEGYDVEAYRHWLSTRVPGDPSGALDIEGVSQRGLDRHGKPLWTATRIEVAEKLWGAGYVMVGGDEEIVEFARPLGLNPATSVIDMSGGLGSAARALVKAYGTWVTALEPNPLLAAEGMDRSRKMQMSKQAPVAPYNAEEFRSSRRVDVILAREIFFSIFNKERLFDGIERALKPRGQLLFTDYVFSGAGGEPDVLRNWMDREPVEPFVLTITDLHQALTKRNLEIRASEDITEVHRHAILLGLQRLTAFLGNFTVEETTKQIVLDEVDLWATRVAALEAGLRCYRIYAVKPSK